MTTVDGFAASVSEIIEEALAALVAGDAPGAERQAKAASALIRAKQDLQAFTGSLVSAQEEDEDAVREELRRRLVRFADADRAGDPPDALENILNEGLPR